MKNYTLIEDQVRVLRRILTGGEENRKWAVTILRKLDRAGRFRLRVACRRLDALIAAVEMEESREKRARIAE